MSRTLNRFSFKQKLKPKVKESELPLSDFLAILRTKLANERTFLAYFRTFVVFLSSGVAIVKLEFLQSIVEMGYVLIGISPTILLIGVGRLIYVRIKIRRFYLQKDMDRASEISQRTKT